MDGLSLLTRVGYTIQTISSTEVASLFRRVLLGLPAGMETVVCAAAGDAAAAISEPDALPTDIWDTPAIAMGMYLFDRILVGFIVRHCELWVVNNPRLRMYPMDTFAFLIYSVNRERSGFGCSNLKLSTSWCLQMVTRFSLSNNKVVPLATFHYSDSCLPDSSFTICRAIFCWR